MRTEATNANPEYNTLFLLFVFSIKTVIKIIVRIAIAQGFTESASANPVILKNSDILTSGQLL